MSPFLHTDERDFARFAERGDARALARVFDRNAPSLLGLARHLAPDTSAAEDLVQATFLTAIEKRAAFDPARRVAPWLSGILARHAREARRRAQRDLVDARPAGERDPIDAQDPLADALAAEREVALKNLLDGLPERDAAVLVPHLVEGASAAEIARRVGASVGAVHVRVHRALRRLGRRLPPALAPAMLAVPGSGGRGLEALRRDVLEHAGGGRQVALASSAPSLVAVAIGAGVLAVGAVSLALGARRKAPVPEAVAGAVPADSREAPLASTQQAAATSDRAPAAGSVLAAQAESDESRDGWSITGIVQSRADSQRIDGASAWLRADATSSERLLARPDEKLLLRFQLAKEDLARLEVRAPGYLTWRAPSDEGFRAERLYGDWSESADGERVTFNPFLRPAREGRGRVVDAAGQPVANAALFLIGAVNGLPLPEFDGVEARSGPDGSFDLADLVPVEAREGCALLAVDAEITGAPPRAGWVRLDETPSRSDEELVLRLGHPISAEALAVDSDGQPVPGVRLRALPTGGPWSGPRSTWEGDEASRARRWPAPWRAVTEAITDDAGVARFAGLPALDASSHSSSQHFKVHVDGVQQGVYEVVAAEEDWRTVEVARVFVPTSEERDGAWLPRGATASELARETWSTVQLQRVERGSVAGVVRGSDGLPLSDVRVELEGLTHPSPARTTHADGGFEFEDVDLARASRLWVEKEGHVTLRPSLSSDGPATMDLVLRRSLPFDLAPVVSTFGGETWRIGFSQGDWKSGRMHAPFDTLRVSDAPAGPLGVALYVGHGWEPVARGTFTNDGRPVRVERALDRLLMTPEPGSMDAIPPSSLVPE